MLAKTTPLFSASNALCQWLKTDLPTLPSSDGKQLGTQPLVTDANIVSWQCHVIFTDNWRQHATVIAVEAHSRFTLLIPFDLVPTQDKLAQLICEQWANEFIELLLKQGEITSDQVARTFNLFHQRIQTSEWVRNIDVSVQQQVGQVELYIKKILSGRGLDALDDDLAIELAWQLNIQQKQATDKDGAEQRFYSPDLFLEDGLARFINVTDEQHAILNTTDKAMSLADFLERKKR